MIPLTKTLSPDDYDHLSPELVVVDHHFTREQPQSEIRRWEYAMAMRALKESGVAEHFAILNTIDVGGAGSPFRHMADEVLGLEGYVSVVDPGATNGETLHRYLRRNPLTTHGAVFCISVLEHIPSGDYEQFLDDLTCSVAEKGLLFLTMDIKGNEEPGDGCHFSHMRERIYTPSTWRELAHALCARGFRLLGPADWVYHDDQLYGGPTGYSFASLALVRV